MSKGKRRWVPQLTLPPASPTSCSTDWVRPTHIGEGNLLSQSSKCNANLFWKHTDRLTDTHRNNASAIQASLSSVKLMTENYASQDI